MTQTVLHSTPRPREVLREQLRGVGLVLRWPAAAGTVLGALVSLLLASSLGDGTVVDFHPEHQMLPGMLGLLLPIAVWRGEERFGAGFLWTLPVDRRRHALARVFAGWAWLMGAVALLVLWLLGLVLLTGGNVLAEETLRFLPSDSLPPVGATVDPAVVRSVRWTPEPLLWGAPFTSATGAYLLASALALGTRHPLRWIAGTLLGLFLLALASDLVGRAAGSEWLVFAPSRLLRAVVYGSYGVDALLTAGTGALRTEVVLATGERVAVWQGLPDLRQWAAATLLWLAAGAAALWAAASRHRETRRA